MRKIYKICPFCANEIKEGAVKCQYCHEFLDKTGGEDSNLKKSGNSRYKNVWLWIILGIIFILLVAVYNSSVGRQVRLNHLVDKTMSRAENHKSFDEIKEDLKNVEKPTPELENAYEELGELISKLQENMSLIDKDSLYVFPSDYKNEDVVQKTINVRELYYEYFRDYVDDCDALFKKYESIDDTGTGKYSLKGMLNEIKKVSNSVSVYKDINIKFYSYILTIQEDFYVDDGQVYFYDGGNKMDKYNQLSTDLYNASIKFIEDYNDYMDYLDQYNKYWNL